MATVKKKQKMFKYTDLIKYAEKFVKRAKQFGIVPANDGSYPSTIWNQRARQGGRAVMVDSRAHFWTRLQVENDPNTWADVRFDMDPKTDKFRSSVVTKQNTFSDWGKLREHLAFLSNLSDAMLLSR